ncbi:unnamed protein product, partial [Rotaria sp. Silwood2]
MDESMEILPPFFNQSESARV